VDRTTLLWTLVVFFGATAVFAVIRNATEDEPAGVTVGIQLVALVLIVAGLVAWTRRRRG
jgi:MYXO-CTERM domain-containing protein